MILKQNLINYSRFWYLKLSIVLVLLNALLYMKFRPSGIDPYGGTVAGYLLGIESALIVLFLCWFGMHKRLPAKRSKRHLPRRDENKDAVAGAMNVLVADHSKELGPGRSMQGFLSVHIYLGMALLFLATMHTGFRLGLNVHTLAFALMVLVIISGMYGVLLYLNYPIKMTQNLGETTLADTLRQIGELDESAKVVALDLPDEVSRLVIQSRLHTDIGATPAQRLLANYPSCPTRHAVRKLRILAEKYREGSQPQKMRELYSLLLNKQTLVNKARLDIMYKARLAIWLHLHIPLAAALFLTLLIHILAVLYFW